MNNNTPEFHDETPQSEPGASEGFEGSDLDLALQSTRNDFEGSSALQDAIGAKGYNESHDALLQSLALGENPDVASQMTEEPEISSQMTTGPETALQSTAALSADLASFGGGANMLDMNKEATRVGKSAMVYGGVSALASGGLAAAGAISSGVSPGLVAAAVAPAAAIGGAYGAVAGAVTYGGGMLHNTVWGSKSNPKPTPGALGTFLRGTVSGVTVPVGLVYRQLLGIGK